MTSFLSVSLPLVRSYPPASLSLEAARHRARANRSRRSAARRLGGSAARRLKSALRGMIARMIPLTIGIIAIARVAIVCAYARSKIEYQSAWNKMALVQFDSRRTFLTFRLFRRKRSCRWKFPSFERSEKRKRRRLFVSELLRVSEIL